MKNILLFQLVGGRPQAQSSVESDADTIAVVAPFLLRLEADDVTLHEFALCRSLPQQPSQLLAMALTSRRRH